jgi:hypothetical protein
MANEILIENVALKAWSFGIELLKGLFLPNEKKFNYKGQSRMEFFCSL